MYVAFLNVACSNRILRKLAMYVLALCVSLSAALLSVEGIA